MAQVTQDTLRLEILREARDNYISLRELLHITEPEAMLVSLKIAECEAMMAELFPPRLARDSIDWGEGR